MTADPRGPSVAGPTFEADVAYIAERLRETYDEEGVGIVLDNLRRARADADQRGYLRGRREALLEAQGIAERFTARATASAIRQRYDESPTGDEVARGRS